MSRIWKVVSASVLLLTVGCRAERPSSDEGRLDLRIQPDSAASSSRPLAGSFALHGLERGRVERIPVRGGLQVVSVPLRAGAYWLEWQPQGVFDAPAEIDGALRMAPDMPGLHIVVAAGRVTTVNVRASLGASLPEAGEALLAELPSVEVVVARH